MSKLILFLLSAAACQILLYGFFHYFLSAGISTKSMRYILLFILAITFLLPMNSLRIELPQRTIGDRTELSPAPEIEVPAMQAGTPLQVTPINEIPMEPGISFIDRIQVLPVLAGLWALVALILVIRMLTSLLRIVRLRANSLKVTSDHESFHLSPEIKNTFSFFHWIFMNPEGKTEEEQYTILIHEKIHASQYHSLDILFIELATAILWFSPGIWMMRKALQQVHEYLADEGALDTGLDKPNYQALLLNQVAEERLIALSSGFNPAGRPGRYSFIKKRIVMMTKPKLGHMADLKLLTLIPLLGILFVGIACVNGQKPVEEEQRVVVVAPTKMNVLYIGVDNPMSIAVSGYDAKDLRVEVDAGKIEGEKGYYTIRPTQVGSLKVFVFAGDEKLSETQFRVKTVPDPVAKIGPYKGGNVSKEDLLKAGKVTVEMENFDFDLRFALVSYVMSASVPNSTIIREEISKEQAFSDLQIDLIKSLTKFQKLMVEDIKAVGPDGSIRQIPSMVFTIQ